MVSMCMLLCMISISAIEIPQQIQDFSPQAIQAGKKFKDGYPSNITYDPNTNPTVEAILPAYWLSFNQAVQTPELESCLVFSRWSYLLTWNKQPFMYVDVYCDDPNIPASEIEVGGAGGSPDICLLAQETAASQNQTVEKIIIIANYEFLETAAEDGTLFYYPLKSIPDYFGDKTVLTRADMDDLLQAGLRQKHAVETGKAQVLMGGGIADRYFQPEPNRVSVYLSIATLVGIGVIVMVFVVVKRRGKQR